MKFVQMRVMKLIFNIDNHSINKNYVTFKYTKGIIFMLVRLGSRYVSHKRKEKI